MNRFLELILINEYPFRINWEWKHLIGIWHETTMIELLPDRSFFFVGNTYLKLPIPTFRINESAGVCEYEGCNQGGIAFYLEPWDKEEGIEPERTSHGEPCDGSLVSSIWCAEHAQNGGFCLGCGGFYAGIESFDFGNGFCFNCESEYSSDEERERYFQDEVDESYALFWADEDY